MSGLPLIRLSATPSKAGGLRPARLVAKWIEMRATRAALARLDTRLLRDIGLEQSVARAEIERPFWRP
ncbi:MAG: DUF1127 domain-containing protein [Sphingomonadales bacterium]|nr:DUF1127 domain-containing protein [Sphingomonadales bacterium]